MDSRQIYVHQSHIDFLLLIQKMKLMDKGRLRLKICLSVWKITGRRFKERKVTFIVEPRKRYETNSRDFWWALLQKLREGTGEMSWSSSLAHPQGFQMSLSFLLSFSPEWFDLYGKRQETKPGSMITFWHVASKRTEMYIEPVIFLCIQRQNSVLLIF